MIVVYATETPPQDFSKSMFLAGPSPREANQPNWRMEALSLLERLNYDGVVFIPLPRDGQWNHGYDTQIEWEDTCLKMADVVTFWVPRDMEKLPGFTTNVEFGMLFKTGKAVLGFPPDAPKMRYLEHHAQKQVVPVCHTLRETLAAALKHIGDGAKRTGGEREVPIHIWKLPHFQSWLTTQKKAGNRLDGADVLWSFRVGPTKGFTFAFVLHVDVHITSEGRNKTNEFVFSRPDIATVVAYHLSDALHVGRAFPLDTTKIALIREFRSPARTDDGFIHEVPGGSSWKPGEDPTTTMQHELEEETGLKVKDPARIEYIGSRQLCGTLSAHHAHVFAIALNDQEWDYIEKEAASGRAHGVEEDTERTYVEVATLSQLLKDNIIDWSMLGMIFTSLLGKRDQG